MNKATITPRLTALGLRGAAVSVAYQNGNKREAVHQPDSVRLALDGMFLEWPNPPADIRRVQVDWSSNPFMPRPFRAECVVVERERDGLLVEFEGPTPIALRDWFGKAAALLDQRVPDAAVKTSRLYTSATVVSAGGLFCGALAILLPIIAGDQTWIDLASKILLLIMVFSIAGFAWLRALAGRAEVRAIGQGQA